MIDRVARTCLAKNMRHLVSGQITNDEFEDRALFGTADPAVYKVFMGGPWLFYSDLSEHRLIGPLRVPRPARRELARCILFLASDLEYEWPVQTTSAWARFVIGNLFTLGWLGRRHRRKLSATGELDVWPFYRRADYELALQASPFRSVAC